MIGKGYQQLLPFEKGNIEIETYSERVLHNEIIVLRGSKRTVSVGKGLSLKTNCSIGANEESDYDYECQKVNQIKGHQYQPDIMMDLSSSVFSTPLYIKISDEIGCPVGTIPYYSCFHPDTGINSEELIFTMEKQAEEGVAFFTLHLTADYQLAKESFGRMVPITSRGGSLLLRDSIIRHRAQNILIENLDRIIGICKKHHVAISLGTTFRPAVIADALDNAHISEIIKQREFANLLIENGVSVMQEGVGHIAPSDIPRFVALIRKERYIPFMPLGPIVSDKTKGLDHICNAIGSSLLALEGGADIINSITAEEHLGGIPSVESILEGIDSAHATTNVINGSRFPSHFYQQTVPERRVNCMDSSTVGCSRCGIECPFIWNNST